MVQGTEKVGTVVKRSVTSLPDSKKEENVKKILKSETSSSISNDKAKPQVNTRCGIK